MSKAKILKPSKRYPSGGLVHPGDPDIEVTDREHDELAALGHVAPRMKAKPAPENKMQPAPRNKQGADQPC